MLLTKRRRTNIANYIIDGGELHHYGVLGMKWGVRRGNTSSAFRKASKKANNLEADYVKLNLKAAEAKKKALTKMSKATSERKYRKARKLEFKANELELKSAKLLNKNAKWKGKMEKAFSETKISDISPEDLDVGKRYVYMLSNSKKKSN